jgi:two-component system, NtrC family, sensor histidine kinase KinB
VISHLSSLIPYRTWPLNLSTTCAMTFRRRIIAAMIPLIVLLVMLGATGGFLINQLGKQIDKILRENYDTVVYMRDLNEALERIDSSFQFALAGKEKQARDQYQANWASYQESLRREAHNITIHPREDELVKSLADLSQRYQRLGETFFESPAADRSELYFGKGKENPEFGAGLPTPPRTETDGHFGVARSETGHYETSPGLYDCFRQIKAVSGDILRLNEKNMFDVNDATKMLARRSLLWYGGGLACGIVLAAFLMASTIRTIVAPVRAVTESATAIGAGNLDQVVPIMSDDELGRLAAAFNTMARQLREFRQSHKAQLIRAQRTSQATIDSFPEPVLVVDWERRVEMANPAARRLFGLPQRESGNGPLPVWEPPDALREPLAAALREQREYVPEGFDKVIVLHQGEEHHSYLPRVLPIRDASATLGAAVLLENVTRFRLLDEVKTNMVATVSHELKTPLTSIRLVIHLLLEEQAGPLQPKQLELLIDARDNAERLLTMINNLLDLARLERGSGQLTLEAESPAALLRAAYEAFLPRARDRGVELVLEKPECPEKVLVDRDRLEHALQNLLDNALAHTPQGGRITLAAEPADDGLVLSVSDTGSGIPAEYLPHVFERHFRVPGDMAPGGTGLGLAIVREIATAHGGTVECRSTPGKRTVFCMKLPHGK